jgi:diphthamide synthase (EF-2-diphthine--ammonia ligase)
MGLEGVFPLWKVPTYDLIQEFIALGFKTSCLFNERYLDKSFIGRVIDQNFINDLPENVDVCGETANFIPSLLMGLFSQNRLILKLAKSCIVNTKTKEDSSNTVCESDATDVFDYGFWYCDLVEK